MFTSLFVQDLLSFEKDLTFLSKLLVSFLILSSLIVCFLNQANKPKRAAAGIIMRMSSQHVYFEIHECCTVHIPFLINLNVHQQQPNLLAIIDMPTTVFPPKCHAVLHHYQPLTHHYQNDDRRERLDESNQGYKLEISHVVISPIWPQIINPSSSHKQLKTLLCLHCNHTC